MFKWIIDKLDGREVSSTILAVMVMLVILLYVTLSNRKKNDGQID
jgi:hypothetical protein